MQDEELDQEIEFIDMEEEEDVQPSKAASAQKGNSNAGRDRASLKDDWEEEPEPMKPWMMVLVFLVLVILAAAICALLWIFTHRNDQENSSMATDRPVVIITDEPEQAPQEQEEQALTSMEEPTVDPEQEQTPAPGEMPTATPEPEQTPAVTESPAATLTPGTDQASSFEDTDMQIPTDGDVSMNFNQVQESVTPKDVVNLRTVPSIADENTVVVQVSNGEVLSRTGINPNMGWSRIDYNGQTLYAVSRYLTTDLTYKPPVQASDPNRVTTVSGRLIIFENCDDYLTPKEYVNLRIEPSTTEGDATVRCQISNGETVHRTGYSPDYGWSRVEYNGEVLYVVTSLMQAP